MDPIHKPTPSPEQHYGQRPGGGSAGLIPDSEFNPKELADRGMTQLDELTQKHPWWVVGGAALIGAGIGRGLLSTLTRSLPLVASIVSTAVMKEGVNRVLRQSPSDLPKTNHN